MHVLITGGSGNIGRCIAAELAEHGHEVTLIDRVAPDEAPTPWQTDLPFVKGALTSLHDCMRAVRSAKAEAICHVGAITYATDRPLSVASLREQHSPRFRKMKPSERTQWEPITSSTPPAVKRLK